MKKEVFFLSYIKKICCNRIFCPNINLIKLMSKKQKQVENFYENCQQTLRSEKGRMTLGKKKISGTKTRDEIE